MTRERALKLFDKGWPKYAPFPPLAPWAGSVRRVVCVDFILRAPPETFTRLWRAANEVRSADTGTAPAGPDTGTSDGGEDTGTSDGGEDTGTSDGGEDPGGGGTNGGEGPTHTLNPTDDSNPWYENVAVEAATVVVTVVIGLILIATSVWDPDGEGDGSGFGSPVLH